MSNATLLFPSSPLVGENLETLTIYAARRCRTTKQHDELMAEVLSFSDEKRTMFLQTVIFQDWAADVLEIAHLVYDIEDAPLWLVIELLRHRLIARDFSLEQLSQRAIDPARLRVSIQDPGLNELAQEYLQKIHSYNKEHHLPPEQAREAYLQSTLVNFVIAGNLRAFSHFWFMRASEPNGKGGAHPMFQRLADQMLQQA